MTNTDKIKEQQKADDLLNSPRGHYLIKEAMLYYSQHPPETQNIADQEDIIFIARTLFYRKENISSGNRMPNSVTFCNRPTL